MNNNTATKDKIYITIQLQNNESLQIEIVSLKAKISEKLQKKIIKTLQYEMNNHTIPFTRYLKLILDEKIERSPKYNTRIPFIDEYKNEGYLELHGWKIQTG